MCIVLVKPYLSIRETIDFVFELTGEKIDGSTLEELSNVEQLTPVFLFSGYVSYPDINHKTIRYDKMKAYFTHDDFFMHQTRNYEAYSMYGDADVGEWIEIHSPFTIQKIIKQQSKAYSVFDEVFLFKTPPIGEINKLDDLKCSHIDFDEIRFSRNELIAVFDIKQEKRTVQSEFDFYLGAMDAIKERASAEVSGRNELNLIGNQKILASYALFTPHHIACFLSNENPAYEQSNDTYRSYLDMVGNAVEANVLKPINEKEQISAEQVKEWLASHNFVYKGFNDGTPTYADQLAEMKEEGVAANVKVLNLTDKLESLELDNMFKTHIASELNDSSKKDKKRIAELEQQLAEKEANAGFTMGNPTVEQGESRDSEQIINDFRDQITQLTAENDNLNSRLSTARNTYKQHRNEIKALKEKNEQSDNEKAELIEQLNKVKAEFADKPADSVTHSNTDIQNIKKAAIKQFNRSLATVLIELDYQGKLRKNDIANYIMPYMKDLAFVLADENTNKANNLTVTYGTLYDTHLQGLKFKQGRQSNDEKQKVNIDLLFKKQLPVTE